MALYATKAGVATTSDLYTLDPATAAPTSIGATGYAITGLAFDPTDATLFGVSSPQSSSLPAHLLTINVSTGAAVDVGALGRTVPDIAFDSTGALYGWTTGGDDLVTINKATGAATVVGDAGITIQGAGISFHSGGTLYGLFRLSGGLEVYTINKATGAVTDLGQTTPFSNNIPSSASFDSSDLLWYLNGGGSTVNLQTLDVGTLARTTIGPPGANFDAIAWSGVGGGGGGGGGGTGAQPEGVSIAFNDPALEAAPTWTRVDV